MKVEQLFVYPIKSLRGSSIPYAEILPTGFKYDRTFMLLKVQEDGSLSNMQVATVPEMCLFTTEIVLPDIESEKSPGHIIVSHTDPSNPTAPKRRLHVPLEPDTEGLELVHVDMYGSKTEAFSMGTDFNDWFSSCIGYRVVLAYIGAYRRPVLGNFPSAHSSFSDLKAITPSDSSRSTLNYLFIFWNWLRALFLSLFSSKGGKDLVITFADVAPLLTVTTSSLANVAARLPPANLPLDVTKFRPNILVDGSPTAWEEDFWSLISFQNHTTGQKIAVELTANCGRCTSLNVDYNTGRFVSEESAVLKRLMKDRRVDTGVKYSPVFGRYGFPRSVGVISVGDEVSVMGRNSEHTTWSWVSGDIS